MSERKKHDIMESDRIIKSWLIIAIDAALNAGKAILEIYSKEFKVSFKTDHSPLTEADLAAHGIISEKLKVTGIPLLSEESADVDYDSRKQWQHYWLVDPLDGTKEFVNRNGEFTVNIALISNHYPEMGVIYAPAIDLVYFTFNNNSFRLENASAADFSNLEQLLTQRADKLPYVTHKKPIRIVASRSHMNEMTNQFIRELINGGADFELVTRGSSLKFCLMAEGTAHIYPRFGPTMEWDTAAGQAIAEKAGCTVVNAENQDRLSYNKKSLLNPYFVVKRKQVHF